MLETALKLSDSRLMLFGAIAVDTVCMGTLAVLLSSPRLEFSELPPSLLLVSLAVTGPVLALAVGGSALLISKKHSAEERARRAIFAGTVLHLGAQSHVLIAMLCACGARPESLRAYMLQNILTILVLLLAMIAPVLWLRWRGEKQIPQPKSAPPSSELQKGVRFI